jgi:hypothetical protein
MPDFCRVGSYWCQVYATAAIGCGLPLVYFMRLSLAERRKRGFILRGSNSGCGPVGARDFFNLAYSLWVESSEKHLTTVIAGVLRLRATSRPFCDRSARRFAQDDGFVGE